LLVVVAVNDTVRLTRLLPATEPTVTQTVPFQAWMSNAVTRWGDRRCRVTALQFGGQNLWTATRHF
jgi:hypothetical protein